jgi:hypothetical protein
LGADTGGIRRRMVESGEIPIDRACALVIVPARLDRAPDLAEMLAVNRVVRIARLRANCPTAGSKHCANQDQSDQPVAIALED